MTINATFLRFPVYTSKGTVHARRTTVPRKAIDWSKNSHITEIFDFRTLPDASRIEAKIITTRGYLFRD